MTRKSYMKPREFKRIIEQLFGKQRGNQAKMAKKMKKSEMTISRYCTGMTPIGGTEAELARMMLREKRRKDKESLQTIEDLL